jgi:ribokinase
VKPNILVVGSLNADLVQRVERLPRPGETLTGSELQIVSGGKGANQAYAAALLGARVCMAGKVGSDPFGSLLVENLQQAGVDVSFVKTAEGATGTAGIFVLPSGENVIILSPGANGKLIARDIEPALAELSEGSILLAQLEVPIATTEFALRKARACRAITMLDPAPAQQLPASLLELADFLTPNQTEAALLLGGNADIVSYEDAEAAGRRLIEMGARTVILKLGPLGVVIVSAGESLRIPGFRVDAVDTTAAGDVFNAAFAVALGESKPLAEAARFANAAGAISVTRTGAQSSIPKRKEVEEFLAQA